MCIVFQVLAVRDNISEDTYTYVSSFFVSLVFVAAIASFVFSIKGLKEPISVKKIIGLSVNALLILLLIAVIVANVINF
jgi:hypothetical protein